MTDDTATAPIDADTAPIAGEMRRVDLTSIIERSRYDRLVTSEQLADQVIDLLQLTPPPAVSAEPAEPAAPAGPASSPT